MKTKKTRVSEHDGKSKIKINKKQKDDYNKNPEDTSTSMGEYWLNIGKVVYLKQGERLSDHMKER